MKIATYVSNGRERLGFVVGQDLIDPILALGEGALPGFFADTLSFIRGGQKAAQEAARLIATAPSNAKVSLSKATLTAPMRPSTILCSGSNYQDHNKEKANAPTSGKEPEFFVKTSDCVVGPGEPIIFDQLLSQKLDCEAELAIVIGKHGRHIAKEDALDYVFGYAIVNDVTARDRQVRRTPDGMTWYELGSGKAFDSSAPIGPYIVTADEVGDPQNLRLQSRVNGELRQSSNTSNMIWSCADLIHFFSRNFTLKPGIVIITGTPAGTAWSADRELGGKGVTQPGLVPATRYCLPGDIIECEIEKLGILRNPIGEAGETGVAAE